MFVKRTTFGKILVRKVWRKKKHLSLHALDEQPHRLDSPTLAKLDLGWCSGHVCRRCQSFGMRFGMITCPLGQSFRFLSFIFLRDWCNSLYIIILNFDSIISSSFDSSIAGQHASASERWWITSTMIYTHLWRNKWQKNNNILTALKTKVMNSFLQTCVQKNHWLYVESFIFLNKISHLNDFNEFFEIHKSFLHSLFLR